MIYKSYIIEENINLIKNNIVLFYGQNLGLINEFKIIIKRTYHKHTIIRLTQQEILNDQSNLINNLKTKSLFAENKIFFIDDANDKLVEILEEILTNIDNNKIYVFANILDKKSKLRLFFEKQKMTDTIPCYQDTELSIKKKIIKEFKEYSALTPSVINLLIENCSLDRLKLQNEIDKIKSFFQNKMISGDVLHKLLNIKEDENFDDIKDQALSGDKIKTNYLLNSTEISSEKSIYYLSSINLRFSKLKEVVDKKENLETAVSSLKPPIFWKDKPLFLKQARIWTLKKLNAAMAITFDTEVKIKNNSTISKKTIIKKLLVDICNLANAA